MSIPRRPRVAGEQGALFSVAADEEITPECTTRPRYLGSRARNVGTGLVRSNIYELVDQAFSPGMSVVRVCRYTEGSPHDLALMSVLDAHNNSTVCAQAMSAIGA